MFDRFEVLRLEVIPELRFGAGLLFTADLVVRVYFGATRVLFERFVLVLFTEDVLFLGVVVTRRVFLGGVAFTRVFVLVLFVETRCVFLVGAVFTALFLVVLFAETRCVFLAGATFTGVLLCLVETLRCGAAFTGVEFRPMLTDGFRVVFVRTVPLFRPVVVALFRPVVVALFLTRACESGA